MLVCVCVCLYGSFHLDMTKFGGDDEHHKLIFSITFTLIHQSIQELKTFKGEKLQSFDSERLFILLLREEPFVLDL